MPAPALDVDWEVIKAHAITHGVREAARAFGIKEDTVKRRCTREGWVKPVIVPTQQLPKTMQKKPVPNVPTASEAARNTLERYGERGRTAAAKTVVKGLETASKWEGDAIVAAAPALASLGKLAVTAKLPGWADTAPATALLGIALSVSTPAQVLDVEATVIEQDSTGQSKEGN